MREQLPKGIVGLDGHLASLRNREVLSDLHDVARCHQFGACEAIWAPVDGVKLAAAGSA
jgi:hypothetical protein